MLNIHIQILVSDSIHFLKELVEKICLVITEFFLLTLIIFLLDYVLVWLGEN